MKRITNIADLRIGKQYLMVSKHFKDAKNNVTMISDDYSGLNRDIAYLCFTERVFGIPTKQMYVNSMQNNRMVFNTFALWGFSIKKDSNIELFELEQKDYVHTMKRFDDIEEIIVEEKEIENKNQTKMF